jgi:branched-chain amino acid transport system substrate-binding protein
MQKYLKLSVFLFLAVLMVSISCVGCGGGDDGVKAPSATKEPYVIGAIFSTSGSGSNLGVPEENTVKMLVADINAKGGINGHNLSVIIYNDDSTPDTAKSMAEKLIQQDKVLAIIGPTTSGCTLAILDTVNTANVTLVSCAASAAITTPVTSWVFKTPQTDKQVVREIYAYLQKQGIKKVAIITATSSFGVGGRTYLLSEAANFNISLVADQTFDSADTSMIPQLTLIKGTDAQAVVCWDTDKASAAVAKDMKTLNFGISLYCSHGIASQAFIDAAGDAANGVIFPAGKLPIVANISASDPQQPILMQYKAEYVAKYDATTLSTYGGHAYDSFYIVVNALKGMKEGLDLSASRAAVRDGVEKTTNFIGISGIFTMSPTDHLGMQTGSLALIRIDNGIYVPVK